MEVQLPFFLYLFLNHKTFGCAFWRLLPLDLESRRLRYLGHLGGECFLGVDVREDGMSSGNFYH
jgi:hypothetical protein